MARHTSVNLQRTLRSRKISSEFLSSSRSKFRRALCEQGGIGDRSSTNATAETKDISDHVVLVHGDLSTCERVQSLQKSRGEEKTPWLRYQFVVFILGLFHLKMACADAIWKLFIFPQASRHDETSLFKQVAEIRPKETGKIGSKHQETRSAA